MGLKVVKIVECNDCGADSDEFDASIPHEVIADKLRDIQYWIVNKTLTFARCDTCEESRLKELEDKRKQGGG